MDASGAVGVAVLSFVMFLASSAAGSLPMLMALGQQRMNMVGSLAIGLLVGTSLGVVLPEGIETVYSDPQTRPAGESAAEPARSHHHLAIALALVTGYLVMHLLTYLPPLFLHNHGASQIPLGPLPSTSRLVPSSPSGTVLNLDNPTGLSNTTIGLSIHALADGIALGSSAITGNLALEGIVFFAIMLHKVPKSRARR